MLADKDRIFTNLYGFHDSGLKGAKSRGDWSTFMTRPLSAGLLIAAALMIVIVSLPSIKSRREEAFKDAD